MTDPGATTGCAPRVLARVPVVSKTDSAVACGVVRRALVELGASRLDVETVSVVVAELATNIVKYGVRGRIEVWADANDTVEVRAHDEGPGFADPDLCLADGYSAGAFVQPDERRLGVGLGAVARLMDRLELKTDPEDDLRVRAWLSLR